MKRPARFLSVGLLGLVLVQTPTALALTTGITLSGAGDLFCGSGSFSFCLNQSDYTSLDLGSRVVGFHIEPPLGEDGNFTVVFNVWLGEIASPWDYAAEERTRPETYYDGSTFGGTWQNGLPDLIDSNGETFYCGTLANFGALHFGAYFYESAWDGEYLTGAGSWSYEREYIEGGWPRTDVPDAGSSAATLVLAASALWAAGRFARK